jgi:uncharacterized protein YbaR (Trm112 family)
VPKEASTELATLPPDSFNRPPAQAGRSRQHETKTRGTLDMALSTDLLDILVCPACRGELRYDSGACTLTCEACRLVYRVVDDIPVMLVEQAERF